MIKTLFSDGNLTWLSTFFFDGDYPLALQLLIINVLALTIFVVMKTAGRSAVRRPQTSRLLFWTVMSANVLLVMNKDFRFVGFLA